MKIVIATNAFKESMTGIAAAEAVRAGFNEVFPGAKYFLVPIADGGDGTLDAFETFLPSSRIKKRVSGPVGKKVVAEYLVSADGRTAVIEMAKASGMAMLKPEDRNPLVSCTYGTGELIRDALDRGVSEIIVGIGGSATNDGGAGIASALGYVFFNNAGNKVSPNGGNLGSIVRFSADKVHQSLRRTKIVVASDVKNPLLGRNGASAIYAPQKGASKADVKILEKNMKSFSSMVVRINGKDFREFPGSGAAGGVGFGLMSFAKATLVPGIELVAKYSGLPEKIEKADIVITGEGFMDSQSAQGKAPFGVLRIAKKYKKPVVAFCGGVEDERFLVSEGFASVVPIVNKPMELEYAVEHGYELMQKAAFRTAALIKAVGIKKGGSRGKRLG